MTETSSDTLDIATPVTPGIVDQVGHDWLTNVVDQFTQGSSILAEAELAVERLNDFQN